MSAAVCFGFAAVSLLQAQVAIIPNVPAFPFQVLAGSTRQINVNITGGTKNTVNWSVASTTGGASATFTTPNGADVSSVAGALATVQVNIGPTQGNCTISGSGTYQVTSTATVTVQAQSVDDPTKTANFLFNVCANSTPTLSNGTSSVVVGPAYQQAYQSQAMTLQSWVIGCTDETGTWSIIKEPSGGNGTLADSNNRDTIFTASVTGRYTIQYTANCNSGTNTAIVYVSPNPMPSYASTPNQTRPHECYVDPELTGADYEVGAGKAYTTIASTPALSGFKPGTILRIWNTDTTGLNPSTFYEYYGVESSGTPTQPIIVCGVADSKGNLPVLDGTNATAQSDVDTSQGGALITLWPGGKEVFGYWSAGSGGPNYVDITGLHLRNANSTIKHYAPGGGSLSNWDSFTPCIDFHSGTYVDISGNELDNCSLGLFSEDNDSNGWATITENLTVIGNHFQLAGDPGYAGGTHQVYGQSFYALFEGNRLDNPTQYVGHQFKWRGVEGIFRYNYLGDGAQRLFDLVDNSDGSAYTVFEQYLAGGWWGIGDTAGANVIAAFQESAQKDFIYGNELLGTSAEAQVHYAYDEDVDGLQNRNGILYFYSNTLDNAQIIFDNGNWNAGTNSYLQARVDARNNILWARNLSWAGVIQMEFASSASIVLSATTNLMQVNTFSIATPILGATWQDGTNEGWPNICDNTCRWPLTIPLNTHLYGLSAANYLTTATQPYNATTFIPPAGSAAIGAGTALTGNPLQYMPVRWQYNVGTGALAPRLDPMTIGAADPATTTGSVAATPTFNPGSGTYSTKQTVTISTSTPGATIYYTTDGSTPNTGSQPYSGPITVSSSETVSAIAVASGYTNSPVGSASYIITAGQVATPTISPAGGTYASAQTVTISDSTSGATIYYTTNGVTPTTTSSVYGGPITVSSTETVQTIAVLSGYTNSAVASATYTINVSAAATPTFSLAAGTYSSTQNVAISDATTGATIYYTTNGSTPTTGSTVYSGPIAVSATETLKAIAVASGYSNSAVATAVYTISQTTTATPIFSPAAGTYSSTQNVAISDATTGATIYYTTNGSTPTTSSTVYSGPIAVSATETLKAIAVASGYSNSTVATAVYTISQTATAAPIFSPAGGTYSSAQNVAISDATTGATIYYTTNGSTPTTSSTVYSGPIGVSATETLEAIAVASSYSNSTVATAVYTIGQTATATPIFSPAGGTYSSAQNVTISDATTGATIYYTTNGSTPTTSSTVYSGPIGVSATETLEAIAVASGYSNSTVATAAYTINIGINQAAAPTFSPAAGSYTSTQTVAISSTTPSATIYYTTNGTTPTASSAVYSGAITVSSSETIEAMATATGYSNSPIATSAYIISVAGVPQAAAPTFTPAGGSYSSAQTVAIGSSTPSAVLYYTTDGSTPTTGSAVYTGPITVASSETLKAIASATGYSNSSVASAGYTITISTGDFSLSASPTSLAVSSTQNGSTAVSVVPQNGFNSTVSFSCSGLPAGTSCAFAPSTLTPSGSPVSTTLTVAMAANASGTTASNRNSSPLFPGSVLAVALCCFSWKKRRSIQLLLLLLISVAGLSLLNGCGGATFVSNSTNTAAKTTAPITVTATSGSIQHTATVSVTVN